MTSTDDLTTALPRPDFGATYPGPFPVSPHAAATAEGLVRWLERHPLYLRPEACRALADITAHGAARTLPTADADGLELFARLFLWLVAFDDVHAETNAAEDTTPLVDEVALLTLVLAGDELPPEARGPFPAALRELLGRFRDRAAPAQYLTLTGRLRDNLTALVWEAHHLADPARVTPARYRAMRPHTVFVKTVMTAVEIVQGYELTPAERELADVRLLEKAVADFAGTVNDLASYAREAARSSVPPLSLPTLLRGRDGSLAEAFARACRLCEDEAAAVRRQVLLLGSGHSPAVAAHAEALDAVARTFVWHTGHARYR